MINPGGGITPTGGKIIFPLATGVDLSLYDIGYIKIRLNNNTQARLDNFGFNLIPEPSTGILALSGAVGFALSRRRR